MYRRHVAPQTQNERTSSLTRGAKRRAGVKIAAFGVSAPCGGTAPAARRGAGNRNN